MSFVNTPQAFATTRWSLIMDAADQDGTVVPEALNALCRVYWPPVYGFCRMRGMSAVDAEDATQGFFAQFLARGSLGKVDRLRGRFRSFLLTCLKNYLADLQDHSNAQRRVINKQAVPLDRVVAEGVLEMSVKLEDSPDIAYDRQWARTTVDRALAALRKEYTEEGRGRFFAMLNEENLAPNGRSWTHAEMAEQLSMAEAAVKYQARVLRRRFSALLRSEVANAVDNPLEVNEELRHLLALLR